MRTASTRGLVGITILLLCIASVEAWRLHVSPNGDRLANRKSGDNFLVVCSVLDYDGPASAVKIEWFKGSNEIKFGRVMTIGKPNASQLMIIKARKDDSGAYVCKAEINGESQEATADISFIRAPEFVDAKVEQHPEDGTTAEIICRVEGEPQLEIFWQFNGNTLDETSPRGYEFKENNQILIIPNYDSKKDDGHYLCNAAQFSSFETQAINVSGYSRPKITVFDGPENNRGFEGHSVQFQCGAIGKPKPVYKWFKVESNEEIVKSDVHAVDDGLLVIHSLSSGDVGEYRCEATNDIGADERIATLSVFLRPRVERLVNNTKQENESVDIVCKYSGEGKVKAKFVFGDNVYKVHSESDEEEEVEGTEASNEKTDDLKNDGEQDNGENKSENAENDDAEDDGDKEEVAVNDAQNDASKEQPADVSGGDTSIAAAEQRRRFKREMTNNRVTVREEDNQLVLTIGELSHDDAGLYKCVVENEAGAVTRTSHLAITHAPVMKRWTEKTVRSFDGNEVELFCEVKAVPEPNWVWEQNGQEVEADGAAVRIDTEGTRTTLSLRTSSGRYGEYKCIASNGVGVPAEKVIEVVEVYAPPSPTHLNCQEHVYPNYATCSLSEEQYGEEKIRPTEVEFAYAPSEDVDGDFNWERDSVRLRAAYDERMRISDLKPNSAYLIRARAINEAGESELGVQATIETTDPWAPERPESVSIECDERCTVTWNEPNNHGASLTGYKVAIREYTQNKESDEREYGSQLEISVSGGDAAVELTQLQPSTHYEVSVSALNSVGESEARVTSFETPSTLTPYSAGGLSSTQLIIIVVGVLCLVCTIVDLICFATNRCGVLACICLNCCGRSHDRKNKDLEAGRPESNRLLAESSR